MFFFVIVGLDPTMTERETSPAAAGLSLFQERFDIIMKFLFITAAPADDIFVAEAEKRNTDLPAEFELADAL